jgi:histidinol-phosphate aminotransferase
VELSFDLETPKHVASLVPYPYGKPIEETCREYGLSEVVKLASNENPLGPSPLALEAAREALKSWQLYPDGGQHAIKEALAKHLGCAKDQVAVGCGSNEFIDILPRAFVPAGRNIVSHQAAFAIYKLCAQLSGCGFIEAPIDGDLRVSGEALLRALNADTRLVMLANPNNPTGSFLAKGELEGLAAECLKRKILLVLDYAYWEYVTDRSIPDPMEIFAKFPNVVVLRTFSKIYGLAGARVGYMVADRKVIAMSERVRQPFNVGSASIAAAIAALSDRAFLERSVKLNVESKAEIERELKRFPVRVYPSQGNFLLVDMKRPSAELYPEFLKRGVIVRPVTNYGLPSCLRVTAGLPEENRKFFQAMTGIFGARQA